MPAGHKNKTLATLLASTLGVAGLHRFYLRGWRDRWAWLHLASLPLSALGSIVGSKLGPAWAMALISPFILSLLAALLEALVLGLTPDSKWDAKYNPTSGRKTESTWPLALVLVLTLAGGMGGLIFVISRSFDLIFTGGSYG
jgi:hypothetical protein